MTIKAIVAYQPTRPVPDRQDLVRMQQQPVQAINEILARLQALENPTWYYVGKDLGTVFANGWKNFDVDTHGAARFCKTATGHVRVEALVSSGMLTLPAFVLPVGYRPEHTVRYCAIANGAAGYLYVDPNGNVVPYTGSTTWYSLDQINFKAA